jgi:serine/threonine protein kinase/Tfp pilus assembly protein PilF
VSAHSENPPAGPERGNGADAEFTIVRSRKLDLLEEQRSAWEAGTPLPPEDLLARWPVDASSDRDAASVLYQDFLQRRVCGEDVSSQDYRQRFPEHEQGLAALVSHHALLKSFGTPSGSTGPTLGLPEVGDKLFGFQLLQELGHGAFARVFLARQGELADRAVVLKISAIEGSEPQTLAQLQHTHIVPIYSVHEDARAGLRAVCMPYFGGVSLAHVLRELWAGGDPPVRGEEFVRALAKVEAPLPTGRETPPQESAPRRTTRDLVAGTSYVRAAAWIVSRLAEGLQHAHERGVLHRDVKPSNILISADAEPLLLDFNVSQEIDCDPTHATLGGTVGYMSPEHLQALLTRTEATVRQVDRRSDVYSLGMVLYEMLAGHKPFEQTGSYSVPSLRIQAMALERSKTTPSLRAQRPEVPWSLESILRKCLDPNPARRYQQADHLAEDLRRFLDDRSLKYAPELSRVEQARKWARRHPRLTTAASVALVAALLLAGAGAALTLLGANLTDTREQLSDAQAREQKQAFDGNVVRALCLVNTVAPQEDHLRRGVVVCERALSSYGVLEGDGWQSHPLLARLSEGERRQIAEDVRELLLLLAGARVRLAPHEEGASRQALALLDRAELISGLEPSRALWQERARYLDALGQAESAKEARRRADDLPAANARDHYLLAAAYARQGTRAGYAQALAELDAALELDPRHYWSWFQRGLCHQELGEPLLASDDFGNCTGLWPDFAWGYFNQGYVFDQAGKRAEAIRKYTAALKHDPEFISAYLNRGLARLESKQYAAALADFDQVRSLGRSDASTQAGRGMALEGLGRPDEADEAFREALARAEVLPEDARARLRWSYGFAVAGRLPDAARAAFDEVLARDPNQVQALYGRAMIAMRLGNADEALTFFDRAERANPDFMDARRYRAVLLARTGALERATQEINACLQREPNGGATLYAAACVAALASEKLAEPRLAEQALDLLQRAAANGAALDAAGDDPDLAALRGRPGFKRLIDQPLSSPPHSAK